MLWGQLLCFSCVQLCVVLWTVAGQAPLSMGFSRKEYWTGSPWPPAWDLPDPGIKPWCPALAGWLFTVVPLLLFLFSC